MTSVPLFLAAVVMFFTLVEHPKCVGESDTQFSVSYVLCTYAIHFMYTGLSAPDEVHSSNLQCELINNPCSQ